MSGMGWAMGGAEISDLLSSFQRLKTWTSLLPVAAAIILVGGRWGRIRGRLQLSPFWVQTGMALALACYLIYGCHYPFRVGLYDHAEPAIYDTTQQLLNGRAVYQPIDGASLYTLPYGPNAYVIPAATEWLLGNSVRTAKLLSAGLDLASLGLVLATMRSLTSSAVARNIGAIYFCAGAVLFREKLVWLRSDPQLLFWASLAMWGSSRRRPLPAFAIMGMAAAALFNNKATALLDALPALALSWQRGRRREWAALLGAFGCVALFPFCFTSSMAWLDYLARLRNSSRQGVGLDEAKDAARTAGMLLVPVLIAGCRWIDTLPADKARKFLRLRWWNLGLGFGSGLVLAVFAFKRGSGGFHLMPLLPAGAAFLALGWGQSEELDRSTGQSAAFIYAAPLVPFGLFGIVNALIAVGELPGEMRAAAAGRQLAGEVRYLSGGRFGNSITMGCGSDGSYDNTFFRTEIPVTPEFIVEAATVMDMRAGGLKLPAAALAALRTGQTKQWIIPRGEQPFTLSDFYDGKDLFGPEWREIFAKNYERRPATAHFDVWTFRGARSP